MVHSYNLRPRRTNQPPPTNDSAEKKQPYNLRKRRSDQQQPEPPTKRIKSTLKLHDLYFDCYEQIFKHLNREDLINLGEASAKNENLNEAVTYAFVRNCGDALMITSNSFTRDLRILRCFGHAIKKVHFVNFGEYDTVECFDALIQHGGKKLLDLQFTHTRRTTNQKVNDFFVKLPKLFPNLTHLAHHNDVHNYVQYENYVHSERMPSLKEFTMKVYRRSIDKLKEFVLMNPQLKKLSFKGENMHIDDVFFRYIFGNLLELEKLHLEKFAVRQNISHYGLRISMSQCIDLYVK